MIWEILNKRKIKNLEDIKNVLLENRGILTETEKKKFFNPVAPQNIKISDLGVSNSDVKKSIERLNSAKKNNEDVVVYGDYDADGICATAILWEALHNFGLNVLPHIPNRFEEGYGINPRSITKIKSQFKNLKLIVTVDNGIVGYEGIKEANKNGLDVIVIDHHVKGESLPESYSIIHSTQVCGSALAYFFAKELDFDHGTLELAAIGTIADQMPLVDVNRSIVKYGLDELSHTKRPGLKELFIESGILDGSKIFPSLGTYEVNYIIAPRLNAMGRLANAIDSLRLICTTNIAKAKNLAHLLSKTNIDRQKIVDTVVEHTQNNVIKQNIIVIADESYHEGVIGLAAGKLTEEYYRPAIVISKGKDISKASARSISGFNIIEAIKATKLIKEGGGHPMAAGFSIETKNITEFTKVINKYAEKILDSKILERRLKIDCEINFDLINGDLVEWLKEFNPVGLGNPSPVFMCKEVNILETRPVGKDSKHLKFKFKQTDHVFDAIFFGNGHRRDGLKPGWLVEAVFQIEENVWNNNTSIQLKIKDINPKSENGSD